MVGISSWKRCAALLLLGAVALADEEAKTTAKKSSKPPVPQALNKVFKGKITALKGRRVTLYYDFEDPKQLEDFETARPPRLLDASQNRVRIQGGRLLMEGSSAIRHKMEGQGELWAEFSARLSNKGNFGTVFTEPLLSDFYIVLNLFDRRFYQDGALILAGCGLHEDEGAQDLSSGLVNWRDIFKSNVNSDVKIGQDIRIKSSKNGFKEYCRIGTKEGKGSSKGKCRRMSSYQFGIWVHHTRVTIDDLTISIELTDEFLALNNLKGEIEKEPVAKPPEKGPLAGIEGVPPRVLEQVEAYAAGTGDALDVVAALENTALPPKARQAIAKAIIDRKDPKVIPVLIDSLYSDNIKTRKLAISIVKAIVGKDFGYRFKSSEKKRSKAIQKLNRHMAKDFGRYYG